MQRRFNKYCIVKLKNTIISKPLKYGLSSILFSLSSLLTYAQFNIPDSVAVVEWQVEQVTNKRKQVDMDTCLNRFHINNPIFKESIGNTYNGNMGSPYLSQLYFSRQYASEFIFLNPYNAYITYPQDFHFVNTKVPYTNLTYITGAPGDYKEEFYRIRHTQNVNKKLNFDLNIQQYMGNGMYASQTSSHKSYTLASNYLSQKYQLHFLAFKNSINNYENGGITNDLYITNPEKAGSSITQQDQIPVNITDAKSRLVNDVIYLAQTYQFNIKQKTSNDSVPTQVIPFANLSHTLMFENNSRTHEDNNANFYTNDSLGYGLTYARGPVTSDQIEHFSLKNTIAIDINEAVNRWAKFGVSAFLEHQALSYRLPSVDTAIQTLTKENQNNLILGGSIYKKKGEHFRYDAHARFFFLGERIGDLNISGNIYNRIHVLKRALDFHISARLENKSPDYFYKHFNSNYYQWDNNFNASQYITFNATLTIPSLNKLRLFSSVENVSNYIFWGQEVKPEQYTGQLQVLQLGADINLKWKRFHFDNQVIFQESSQENILSLPLMTTYSNLYYGNTLFQVMQFRIGVEARYFTSYYAPSYMPLLGQYHNQDEGEVGDFPLVSPYLSFHLKRFRFFLKRYNFGEGFGSPNYFTAPHYPLNPSIFHFGLSWNFYT